MQEKRRISPLPKIKYLWQRLLDAPWLYLVAAFLIPLLINWLIFIIKGVYPFGNGSVLVLDLNGQYVYFIEAMKDILQGQGSPFYSWYRALGGEFSGIYGYYTASPFLLLTLLFPDGSITEALLAITLLKTGAMGLTFGIYLHNSRPSKPVNVIIFSTMYALTSYALVHANNTMWMDALIYLPLIILGIENIIHRGKFIMYTVVLALCFIANFYIGFMIAVFCTIYFFCYYFAKYPVKLFTRFFFAFYKWLVCSVAAGGIASIIILPTYYSLQFGKNTFSNPNYEFTSKFDYINIFTQMLPNSYDTVRPEGLPFLYCGVLALILLPVFFITPMVKGREKIASGIMLALMVFSFTASTVDLFWHGLQRPNWLNYRYSFMFCFLVLVFAYDAFRFMKSQTYRIVLGSAAAIGTLTVIVQTMEFEYLPDIFCIWFTIIMLGVLSALLWSVCKNKFKYASGVLCAVVCLELLLNGVYNVYMFHDDVYYSSRDSYLSFMERWEPVVEKVQQADTSFYRMEKTVHRKVNDNMRLRMRGITNSTSTLNASVINLLNKLGYAAKSHWSRYEGGNPVSDSLLGIKYVLSDKNDKLSKEYTLIDTVLDSTSKEGKELYTYKNEYALPLLYGVNEKLLDYKLSNMEFSDSELEYSSPDILNLIVSSMIGKDTEIFVPVSDIDITTDGVREASASGHKKYALLDKDGTGYVQYNFEVEKTGDVYIHFPSRYPRDTVIQVATKKTTTDSFSSYVTKGSYMTNETHTIYNIGSYNEGEVVSMRINLKKEDLYFYKGQDYVFYFDEAKFKAAFETLSESAVNITEYSDTSIIGTVDVKAGDNLMFTSIPYDEGWTVKVDGKKVELSKSLDSLLCFEVEEGEHTIEMSYVPQGFAVGAVACVVCLGVFVYFAVLDTKKRNKRKKELYAVITAADSAYSMSKLAMLELEMLDEAPDTTEEVDISEDTAEQTEEKSDGEES